MESQPLVLLSGAQGYVTSNRPYERSNFIFPKTEHNALNQGLADDFA